MDKTFWIGTIAASLTTLAFLPQVIKAHISKHTKDLSLSMYLLLSVGVLLWCLYGILLNSMPIIVANGLVFVLNLYLLFLKLKHG